MDDGDACDSAEDMPSAGAASDTFHEGVLIEGLRPPLSDAQRLRRLGIAAAAIIAVIIVMFRPFITIPHTAQQAPPPIVQGTTTPDGSTNAVFMVHGGSVSVNAEPQNAVSANAICLVTAQTPTALGMEMHASSRGGAVWALLLSTPAISVNSVTMLIWRVTGAGAFQVIASGPGAANMLPTDGPDLHPSGSNWQRPGDEWGTVFRFPQPGCWRLHITRGADIIADIWLIVGA